MAFLDLEFVISRLCGGGGGLRNFVVTFRFEDFAKNFHEVDKKCLPRVLIFI